MSDKAKKILIVEDELILLEVLVDNLKDEGFNVLEARDGEEGLEVALKEKPDLILLDIMMPKMNGMTMLKKLRDDRWGSKVPVMVLTNVGDSKNVMDALEFDTCDPKLSYNNKSVPKATRQGIKAYLDARLSKGVCEYLIKSNLKIEDVLKKVKKVLR